MRFHPSRPLLAVLAVAYGASLLLYACAWVYSIQPSGQPEVELGFGAEYLRAEHAILVKSVGRDSPAAKAGLQAGDRIMALDGMPLDDPMLQVRIWLQHKPGDVIHLTVRRSENAATLVLTAVFRPPSSSGEDVLGQHLNNWFPWPFLIVGLAVLFLRLENPNAWLLALLFGGIIASRGLSPIVPQPSWWPAAMAYQAIFIGLIGPLFYWFYARFPTSSTDRRWPWLKWALAGLGLLFAWGGIHVGGARVPPWFGLRFDDGASARIATLFIIVCLTLGLVSFADSFFRARDPEVRRKLRLLFWSTLIGLGPNLVKTLVEDWTSVQLPAWVDSLLAALLVLVPLAFAYAVVVHRVLEIPVLLRRGARYLLVQRGFTILLSLVSIGLTILFALSFPAYLRPLLYMDQTSAIALGAVFGTGLLWSGNQVHRRVSGRIDRAFFRDAYDARVLLEELAEKTRAVTDRSELVTLLEQQLGAALKPRFLRVELQPDVTQLPEPPECSVPILGRDGRELGALLLGPRLSEEPYSNEDRRLLASVANQAATALENMQLAETIAARIEGDRRAAREMEIAREVQARLLPQSLPRLDTLDCAARCVQARAVGGDYYDFLDLGPGCAGLVLADVAGKGVHAALLVAHLEAYLRSQSSRARQDPLGMLQSVNQMLYLSTAPQHYATVFFAVYSEPARELLYVNCGHNPPVWLRHDGSVARLESTATVLGAFSNWQGTTCRAHLDPGDVLVIFSDGVTEANNRQEEEFGEARLMEALRPLRHEPAGAIVSSIIDRVQAFSAGTQFDDLTLLVARAR